MITRTKFFRGLIYFLVNMFTAAIMFFLVRASGGPDWAGLGFGLLVFTMQSLHDSLMDKIRVVNKS